MSEKSENNEINEKENDQGNAGIKDGIKPEESTREGTLSPFDSLTENASESEDSETGISENGIPEKKTETADTPLDGEESGDVSKKAPRPRKVSLATYIFSVIACVLAAVMVTYVTCASIYQKKLADAKLSNITQGTPGTGDHGNMETLSGELALLDAIFRQLSFQNLDGEAIADAVLKAYVRATGDQYAAYYTEEEYKALMQDSAGASQGVGINVINSSAQINGTEIKVIKIVNVMKDSPAYSAGVARGDLIVYSGIGEKRQSVDALGYDMALKSLQGEAETLAEFTVFRPTAEGGYEQKEFSIMRSAFTSASVYYHVCTLDASVGIVRIDQFNLTTPTQFCAAVDELKEAGCTKFVLDVRYNPGGDLRSIEAVLSYFLKEGDTIISTKDKQGNGDTSVAKEVSYTGDYAGCSVRKEDIGKYRDLNVVVLCNESTASAAELFTATFRDYKMADIVGMKTYGKGSMQTFLPLAYYGYPGYLKLTTRMYFPASGEGYDGIGIEPDETVELSAEAAKVNIYDLADKDDDQLRAALEHFKK